jgi:hypothetical protein
MVLIMAALATPSPQALRHLLSQSIAPHLPAKYLGITLFPPFLSGLLSTGLHVLSVFPPKYLQNLHTYLHPPYHDPSPGLPEIISQPVSSSPIHSLQYRQRDFCRI